ncbi:MAG: phosphatidate cytidylyltransferase [bacterium]
MTRFLSALAIGAPFLVVVWFAPPAALLFLVFFIALRAGWECRGLLSAAGWPGARWEGALDAAALALVVGAGGGLAEPALALIILRLLVRTLSAAAPREGLAGAGVSLLGALWIGGPAGLFVLIMALPGGRGAVLYLLAVVWANDIAAYYVGRGFGRRRLAPALSPEKTVEGAIGGLVGGVAAGALWAAGGGIPALGPLAAGATALILGVLAQTGDLFESLVKRAAGAKDAGALIPGHGGVLDRIDGLLLAAPPFYYFLQRILAP